MCNASYFILGEVVPADVVVLAVGHSARPLYEALHRQVRRHSCHAGYFIRSYRFLPDEVVVVAL